MTLRVADQSDKVIRVLETPEEIADAVIDAKRADLLVRLARVKGLFEDEYEFQTQPDNIMNIEEYR